ncbi:hypothetical protein YC2023_018046 [Brassica napus]
MSMLEFVAIVSRFYGVLIGLQVLHGQLRNNRTRLNGHFRFNVKGLQKLTLTKAVLKNVVELNFAKVIPQNIVYHPSRVLPLVYQPFAVGTIVILAYHESKINTRKRILDVINNQITVPASSLRSTRIVDHSNPRKKKRTQPFKVSVQPFSFGKREWVRILYSNTPKLQKLLPRHQENAFIKANSRSNRQKNIRQYDASIPKKQTTI